ncbi:S41 family peptidase [Gemmata sp. JC673]|uniref:Tricorn protease homolog n=1 Tax=Gemmata algarum TaxID=2975278 RepID=A0ABU5F998_9BACT|nr:S41 family peptidase [Gemmata algarum]MDY3562978.1 S41 family peptidase [Gemmata algarum]
MRLYLRALVLAALTSSPAAAQEPIRFARTPDISPDGKTVAFSYLGDIWTVEAIGGVARPVTMHEAHDVNPVFSPDGRLIAFSSNRFGQYDVFVVSAAGGKPRRLTFDSAPDMVTGWTPDGKGVVFSSPRSVAYPINTECFVVPAEGGAERKLNLFEAKEAYFAPTGGAVAFVRGPGTWYRRGYRGSSNDDIWISGPDGSNPTRVTTFDGQDSYPMFAPDARQLFYVTESQSKPGCANVVRQPLAPDFTPAGPAKRITAHDDDTVRRARLSANGDWIVYELGADLWVASARSDLPPRKLAIEVNADDKSNTERTHTYTRDATEYALAPDEQHAVLVVHGQLFLTKVPGGGKATRLTEHEFADSNPAWSPDGKKILFASDRGGTTDLYLLESDDPEHTELVKAHKFKTTKLTATGSEELNPTFSPAGDRVAFVREGKLWLMRPNGSEQRVLVSAQKVLDYDWAPDGKHIAYCRMDGSFAAEVYIQATDGTGAPVNVSRHATWNSDVSWSRTNGKLAFVGQRRGAYGVQVVSLQKPVADGGTRPPADQIDWDDLHLRVERPTTMSAEYGAVSPDGSQVAFRSASSGDDLWVVSSNGQALTRMTSGNQTPSWIRWSKKSYGTVYFLNGSGQLCYLRTGFSFGTPPLDPTRVPFSAKITIKRDEEFNEMFAQCWRALADNFYDPAHHGADWAAVRAKFLPLVAHTATREDLYALVSLMLGELNASHLGISGRMPAPDEWTADLGLIFDDTYTGPGLKVLEVLKRGPADKRGLDIKPGDVVLAIDRVPLTPAANVSKLLNNKIGEGVQVELASDPKDAKTKRRVEIVAASRTRTAQLMYERWVELNAAAVAKASNGKAGYIHIPSMDEAGLDAFVRALYSDHFDKESLVIDVRFNGGGFTHDQVLNYLAGKEHTFFKQRDGGEGMVLRATDRKWTKPMVVVANNRSYSDAEIFPHAFRALGLGKVVGQATGGFVIGTGSTRLIDGSSFRLPRIGVYTRDGVNLENQGVAPDVPVEVTPADWARGTDGQLLKAVEVVSQDVAAWRRAKAGAAGGAIGAVPLAAPAPPPVAPMPHARPATGAPQRAARIPMAVE